MEFQISSLEEVILIFVLVGVAVSVGILMILQVPSNSFSQVNAHFDINSTYINLTQSTVSNIQVGTT